MGKKEVDHHPDFTAAMRVKLFEEHNIIDHPDHGFCKLAVRFGPGNTMIVELQPVDVQFSLVKGAT